MVTLPNADEAGRLLCDWAQSLPSSQRQKAIEACSLSRLFDCAGTSLDLVYPVTVFPGEKPDFLIRSALRAIGVEVTRFLAEQLGRAETLARRQNSGMVITPFRFSRPRRTNSEIHNRLHGCQVGLADWVDTASDVAEKIEELAALILKKSEIIRAASQPGVSEPWLLIEDRMYLLGRDWSVILPEVLVRLHAAPTPPCFSDIWFIAMDNTTQRLKKDGPNNRLQLHAGSAALHRRG